jgi:hypothetical protein
VVGVALPVGVVANGVAVAVDVVASGVALTAAIEVTSGAAIGELGVVVGVVPGPDAELLFTAVTAADVVGLAPDEAADVAPAAPLESPPLPHAASEIAASIAAETLAYIMVGSRLTAKVDRKKN